MIENPSFTIITPSFNSEKTILKTVKSVILQNQYLIEYLIIDNCSTDSTKKILEEFKELCFISEKDKGIFDGMNKGVKMARASIIGIINSDDWYLEGSLKAVRDVFQDSAADIVIGGVDIFDGNTLIQSRTHTVDEIKDHMVSHPAIFVRKHVYDILGEYDLKYKVASDYDFILRALTKGFKFVSIPRSVSAYSLGGYSDSPRMRITSIFETESIRAKYGIISNRRALLTSLNTSLKTIARRNHKLEMCKEFYCQVTSYFKAFFKMGI
jgi:glycosyltransferase involved in cell wall biosynthesis